jgi:hypothetical protein
MLGCVISRFLRLNLVSFIFYFTNFKILSKMKKTALAFILLTTIMSACSTSKSNSVAANQKSSTPPTTEAVPQTVDNPTGKNVPTSEAKMLISNVPQRPLQRKKSDKTMEQSFNAAAIRDSL